jgi:hypothetical protein
MEDRIASRIRFDMGQRSCAAALSTASLFAITLTLVQPALVSGASGVYAGIYQFVIVAMILSASRHHRAGSLFYSCVDASSLRRRN